MKKFFFMFVILNSLYAFADKVPLTRGDVRSVIETDNISNFRVYLNHKVKMVYKKDGVVTVVERGIDKENYKFQSSVSKHVSGKIVGYEFDSSSRYTPEVIYVSFSKNCSEPACAFAFSTEIYPENKSLYYIKNYPEVSGYQLVRLETVKNVRLNFDQGLIKKIIREKQGGWN